MSAFADPSAVVKLYADESGHEDIRSLEAVAVAQITRVEVPAALWRKQRMGDLNPSHAQVLVAEFEADYHGTDDTDPRFAVVATSSEVFEAAARLCATHGLRAYDSIQLASAIAARAADGSCASLAAFDGALRAAAAMEGFSLIPAP